MNKKVVLSVLSTTLVASVAASAFAAPKDGIYIGGNIKKYYSTDVLFEMTPQAKATYASELNAMASDFNNVVFVDYKGKGASIEELFTKGSKVALGEPLKKEDFADLYKVVNKDGSSTATEDARAKVDPTPTGDLNVESVSANNLKEVVVTFDKAVDADTAGDKAYYTFTANKLAVDKVTVSGKTVVLTLAAKAENQASYELNVDGIKGLVKTTKEVKFFDNTTPTVAAVAAIGPKQVKVTFSEPLSAKPSFSVNNGAIAVVADNFVEGTKEVILTLGAQPTASTNTVTVEGGADYASYKVEKVTKDFTVVADTTPPTVSVKKASAKQVVLEFSEDVQNVQDKNVVFYHTTKGHEGYKGTILGVDGKEVTISFVNPLPEGQFKIFVDYVVDNGTQISDLWGNKLPEQVITGTFAADTTPPTVTKVEAKTNTEIHVTFSETVNGADNKANFTLKGVTGNVIPLTKAEVVDAAKNIYKVVTTEPLNGGSYYLTVKGIEDASKNKLVEYTATVAVADTVPPNVKDLDPATPGTDAQLISPTKVKIAFTEPMDKASIENKNNYMFNGFNLDSKVTLTATDSNTAVVVDFTNVVGFNGFKNGDAISVGRVLDTAGNPKTEMQTKVNLPNSVSAPLFDKAEVTGKNTVKLYFKELIINAKADDFAVDNGEGYKAVNSISNDVVENKSVITLTTGNDLPTTAAGVKVKTVGEVDAKNQYGVAVALTDVPADDKIGPNWLKAETVDTNNNGKIDQFKLTFSEALYVASVQDSDFRIEGYTIAGVETKGEVVTIKVTELDIDDSDATPTVAVIGSVEDLKRNASGPFEPQKAIDGVSAPDKEAPVVTGVEAGKTYNTAVTPDSADKDIKTVVLKKDGKELAGYALKTPISENGSYELVVTDNAGNTTTVKFKVDIPAEDKKAPEIKTVTDDKVAVADAPKWEAPKATATDDVDGDISDKIAVTYSSEDAGSKVTDLASAQTHLGTAGNTVKVTYNVTDKAGNPATAVSATFTAI
ncbi:outer cell wall protein precursor [Brevibacillus brevis NBRC 100599]|uniref:Outer cell wall protein n=1 Tax=Brevibacillus brevis (strain 47 / JCM 6285 / NBRC 100599) TaxID=358681 RepID=SLAPO_BREBN|nr:outer cell wall protein [Brevibacillus brevis]P09333.1 RecName: Full=Outer cell wall protein; Short=OWP; Flags: Precursor [Brevibacillus brevis NBRC 100599]AAA22373.1 outer wall protein (gtg start codon) [Brevibacillus brevis]BAH46392.1 outer cell wall protein precursor [Brevibacillus brevis NBRC 100599]